MRPRSPDRPGRGAAFALVAHALLIGALSLGVSWRMSSPEGGSAELWSSVPLTAAPQEAAEPPARAEPRPPAEPPRRAEPPPPPAERPAELAEKPQPKPKPKPEPPKRVREPEPAPPRSDAKKAEPKKPESKKAEPRQDARKPEPKDAPKPSTPDRSKPASSKAPATLQSNREEALKRILGQAGGQDATTGAPRQGANSPGKGISDSYAGRIVARVRPNIVFPPVIEGNPKAEVEVRTAADGRIISRRITQSSGVPAWDDAVLRALDRTEVLPLDERGRIPNPMVLTFRPRDF